MKHLILMAVFALGPCLARAGVIPDDRAVNWTNAAGVQGGIRTRASVYADVRNRGAAGDGVRDDWSAIQGAIDRCPEDQVVYLPAGTYRLSRPLTLKSRMTLRGAGASTVLDFALDDPKTRGGCINLGKDTTYPRALAGVTNDVSEGADKGSTSMRMRSTHGLSRGTIAVIDEENDGGFVNGMLGNGDRQQTSSGPGANVVGVAYLSRDGGHRLLGQMIEITAVSGDTIHFTPPLAWSYYRQFNPQVWPMAQVERLTGLEDLAITNSRPEPMIYNVVWDQTADCWMKGVYSLKPSRSHINLLYPFRDEIRECEIRESPRYIPNFGYGVTLGMKATACLVENNIMFKSRPGVVFEGGACYNVISYNFDVTPSVNEEKGVTGMIWAWAGNHGAHPMMNLWEGNIGNSFQADYFHGTSGPNTLFRNALSGTEGNFDSNWAITINAHNHGYNIMGNVLGVPAEAISNKFDPFTGWQYEMLPARADNMTYTIYRLGFFDDSKRAPGFDTESAATLLRHGNYDYAHKSVVWDPAIPDHNLPASMYLTGKPEWWGNLPWPPIGPDLSPMVGEIPAEARYKAEAARQRAQ